MRFAIKTAPQHTSWSEMLAVWQRADEIDIFESAWNFDHFYPIFSDSTGPCLEAWTMLAAMANATRRIRLGVLVTGNIYRHPAVLAKMAATVDVISNGRLELGIGAGWNQQECDAYGITLPPLRERFDMFDEACEVLIKLLSDTTSEFEGRYYQLNDARCEPKPVQRPHPPICIGGGGERRTLRAVAKYAQHWNVPSGDVASFQRKRAVLGEHCSAIGSRPLDDHDLHPLAVRPGGGHQGVRGRRAAVERRRPRPRHRLPPAAPSARGARAVGRCARDGGVMGSRGLASALDSVHDLGPLILERADASEARGCLHDDVVEGLLETGLMRALVPDDLDGLDLTIPDVIELVRVLSTYDASVGWTYAIGVGGPLAGRLLTRDAFETIFRDPRAWMAGSLNPTTSKAEAVDGGYRFSGLANFASGCRHATWLMVGGWVHRDGKPAFTDAGPEFIAGVIPIEQVRITDTWSVTGMRATGSNDCVIEDAFASPRLGVPVVRCEAAVRDGDIRSHPAADAVRSRARCHGGRRRTRRAEAVHRARD